MKPQSDLYEYLEDYDNPELSPDEWEAQMIDALERYYTDNPERYRMKHKNAINNYRSWRREKSLSE